MALTKISTAMWNSVPHHLSHDFNVDDVLFVDVSDNKVGIGTTSPIDQLHIKSTTTDARMVLDGHTGFDAELKFFEAGTAKYTVGYDAATANFVIGTVNVDTNQRLVIDSSGNVGVGSQNPVGKFEVNTGSSAAYFTRTAGNNGSSAPAFGILTDASLTRLYSWGTGMTFWTASVGGTATEKMRLTNTGLLGIGCTPTRELEVEGSGNVYIRVNAKTDNDSTAIELVNTQETWTIRNDDTNNDAFEIDSSTTGNIVTIQKTGNVGIGAVSPSQKLDVNGNTLLRSKVFITGGNYSESDLYILNTNNVNTGVGYAAKVIGVNIKDAVGLANEVYLRSNTGGLTSAGAIYLSSDSTAPNQGIFGVLGGTGAANTQLTHFFTINDQGNVGIGTTSPSYKLDVNGNVKLDYSLIGRGIRSANRGEFHLNSTGATDVAEIFFGYGDGYTNANIRWGISDRGSADDRLVFYKGPYHGGFTEMFTISSTSEAQFGNSVWVNTNGSVNYNDYNENIRLFNAANGVSTIAFGASGASGTPSTSILGFSDRFETRVGSTWRTRIYGDSLRVNGYVEGTAFYDSDNTGYYIDPNSGSLLNAITADHLNLGGASGDYGEDLQVGGIRGRFTNELIHLYNRVNIGNPSGWASQSAPNYGLSVYGGVELSTNTSYTTAGGSMRSPIFYDSNDTGYYTDPGGTSNLNVLNVGGFGVSADNYQSTYTRGFYVAGDADKFYKVRISCAHTDRVRIYRRYSWTIGGSSSYWNGGSSTHFGALNFVVDTLRNDWGGHRSMLSGYLQHNYTTVMGRAHMGVGSENGYLYVYLRGGAGGNGAYYEIENEKIHAPTPTVDYNTYITTADDEFNDPYINRELNIHGTNPYIHYAGHSYRGPIYYDSNDTNYYVDANSTTQLSQLNVSGGSSGYTTMLGAYDLSRTYNDSARNGLVVNAGYYPHITVNAINASNTNTTHGATISMTGYLTSGGFRRWGMGIAQSNPNELSFGYYDNQANPHYGVGVSWTHPAKMWIDTGGHLNSTGSMRTPIFYDIDNTAGYANLASDDKSLAINGGIKFANTNAQSKSGFIGRHGSGGSLATDLYPGAIYSIGDNYRPSGTGLSNHYGVGYSHTNASFYGLSGQNGWGFYVSDAGVARVQLGASNGTISCTGDVVAYASDGRLKENIRPIENALEKVSKINGVYYDWVENIKEEYDFHPSKMHEVGVIAQEIQDVMPEVVDIAPFDMIYSQKTGRRKMQKKMETELNRKVSDKEAKEEFEKLPIEEQIALQDKNDFLTVKYERLVPLLIEAIKELSEKVKMLENK